MIRVIISTIFCLLMSSNSWAVEGPEAGAKAYWAGDFQQAVRIYSQLLPDNGASADLWYNYGTAAAQSGQLGHAIHALEQSLLLQPHSPSAQANLTKVRQHIIEQSLKSNTQGQVMLPGDDLATGLLMAVDDRILGALFGTAWSLLFLLLWIARKSRESGRRTAAHFTAVICALVALISGCMLMGRKMVAEEADYGIVLEKSEGRQGPGSRYPVIATIVGGVKVELNGEDRGWVQITLPTGAGGWLPNNAVKPLKRP